MAQEAGDGLAQPDDIHAVQGVVVGLDICHEQGQHEAMSEVVDPVRLPVRSAGSVPAPGPVPPPVRAAALLVWAVIGLNVVEAAMVLLGPGLRGVLDQSLRQPIAGRPAPGAIPHTFIVVVAVFVGSFFLVMTALYVVMGLRLRAGRTWPRTVLIVLAALSALPAAASLVRVPVEPVTIVLDAVYLGAHVAAVALLLGPVSRAWLRAHEAVRADARRLW